MRARPPGAVPEERATTLMQLQLSDEDREFREEMRELLHHRRCRRRSATPSPRAVQLSKDDIVDGPAGAQRRRVAVPHWPVEYGGQDWTPLQRHIWHEEMQLPACRAPLAFNTCMIGPVLAQFGSAGAEGDASSPATANLDIWWCQGFSEPDAGSDLASLRTTRRPRRRRLGRQRPEDLDDAGPARRLDLLPRAHRPGRQEAGAASRCCSSTWTPPGVDAPPDRAASTAATRSTRSSSTTSACPGENLVGEVNQGWTIAKFLLGNERVGVAPVGPTKRTLAQRQGARRASHGGPLLDDPLIAARIAELENELLALELTALRVVANSADGKPHPASSVLKLKGTELQQAVTELLVDVAGPLSLAASPTTAPTPEWARARRPTYLNFRKASIYGGSNEVQRTDHRRHDPGAVELTRGLHLRRRAGRAARGRARPADKAYGARAAPRASPRPTRASTRRPGRGSPRWACSGCRSPRTTAARAPGRSRSPSWPRRSAASLAPEPFVELGRAGRRPGRRRRAPPSSAPRSLGAVRPRASGCSPSRTPSRAPLVGRRGATPATDDGGTWPVGASRSRSSGRRRPTSSCVTARCPRARRGCSWSTATPRADPHRLPHADGGRASRGSLRRHPGDAARARPEPTAPRRSPRARRRPDRLAANEAVGRHGRRAADDHRVPQDRKQFGVTLNTFQALTFRAADMYVSLELARSTALWAAMVQEAPPRRRRPRPPTAARLQTSRAGRHIGQEAIQLHGGIGVTAEYDVGAYTSRLTTLDHLFGDATFALGALADGVGGYDAVDPLS